MEEVKILVNTKIAVETLPHFALAQRRGTCGLRDHFMWPASEFSFGSYSTKSRLNEDP